MSAAHAAVRARRARLVERAAIERDELAGLLGAWQRPLGAVDLGLAFVRGLKRSAPVIGMGVGVGMAALAFIRPANISGWFQAGQTAWRVLTDRNRRAARRSDRSAEPVAEGGPK
jgi:hypothetical protein